MRDHAVAAGGLCGALFLAACGAPARVETLDRTADFGRAATPLTNALPSGLSDVGVDGPRLVEECSALESRVAALVPDIAANGADGAQLVSAPRFVGRHCQWSGSGGPALAVGMMADSGASSSLDETVLFIDHDRSVSGVGARAVYDPETTALYVVIGDRLWYVQLVGAAASDPSALETLVALGRDLVGAPRRADVSAERHEERHFEAARVEAVADDGVTGPQLVDPRRDDPRLRVVDDPQARVRVLDHVRIAASVRGVDVLITGLELPHGCEGNTGVSRSRSTRLRR